MAEDDRLGRQPDLVADGRFHFQLAAGLQAKPQRVVGGAGHPAGVSDAGHGGEPRAGDVGNGFQDLRHGGDSFDLGDGIQRGWSGGRAHGASRGPEGRRSGLISPRGAKWRQSSANCLQAEQWQANEQSCQMDGAGGGACGRGVVMAWTALLASRGQSDPDSGCWITMPGIGGPHSSLRWGIGNREWGMGRGRSTAGDFDQQVGSAAQSVQQRMVVACAWCFQMMPMPMTNMSSAVLCIGGVVVPVGMHQGLLPGASRARTGNARTHMTNRLTRAITRRRAPLHPQTSQALAHRSGSIGAFQTPL